jgi:hypothetical protein
MQVAPIPGMSTLEIPIVCRDPLTGRQARQPFNVPTDQIAQLVTFLWSPSPAGAPRPIGEWCSTGDVDIGCERLQTVDEPFEFVLLFDVVGLVILSPDGCPWFVSKWIPNPYVPSIRSSLSRYNSSTHAVDAC